MNPRALLTTAYLAPVQYYCKLLSYDRVDVELCEHYTKQTYRNRCVIATAGGQQTLTVPVVTDGTGHTPIDRVRLSEHGHWRHLHWEALVSAYERSPFFEYYADDFAPFYREGAYERLIDFNGALQALVCRLLGIDVNEHPTQRYEPHPAATDDWREAIHPKRPWQGDASFSPQPYYQVFESRHGFQPNLSIVDLLFNMGPEGLITLTKSCAPPSGTR